jgi:SPP1 family predicted phage head-tail adaptor
MEIGKLRHRIEIQKKTVESDALKQEMETWTPFASCWARVEPLNGREYIAAGQVNAELTARITMRYREGVTSDMRVVCKEKVFEILGVVNTDMRNIELVLMCKEAA